jgi:hypothetical protein
MTKMALGIVIVMVAAFFFAPIVPLAYPKDGLLPWVNECNGAAPGPSVFVLSSPSFVLFQRGVAIVPSSNYILQFDAFHPTHNITCG